MMNLDHDNGAYAYIVIGGGIAGSTAIERVITPVV
jgi:hypothetical protein